jgi:hypothetical protein
MNYSEIIDQLADANKKLLEGKISIEVAKQIGINTQTLINGARLQFDVIKHSDEMDNGFFKKQESIDEVLKQIEESKNKTYEVGK